MSPEEYDYAIYAGVSTVQDRTLTEPEAVVANRYLRLLSAGADPESARQLAAATWIDLHETEALLAAGCAPKLAVEILL